MPADRRRAGGDDRQHRRQRTPARRHRRQPDRARRRGDVRGQARRPQPRRHVPTRWRDAVSVQQRPSVRRAASAGTRAAGRAGRMQVAVAQLGLARAHRHARGRPATPARRRVLTSSGSPLHSTRSARLPGAMLPSSPPTPKASAGTRVSAGEAVVPRQAVGDRVAGELADLARVVRGVAELANADRHARGVQARGVLQRRADAVEVGRQVGQRIDEHRHLRGRELRRDLPRLDAAGDRDAHVVALAPAQQLADVGGAIDVDDHAAAAVEVLRAARARPAGVSSAMLRIRRDAAARFVDQLVEHHPLRRARVAGEFGRAAAEIDEQHARADRIEAAVQPHHAALAADDRTAGGRCPAPSRVQPMPSTRATGISTDSGL